MKGASIDITNKPYIQSVSFGHDKHISYYMNPSMHKEAGDYVWKRIQDCKQFMFFDFSPCNYLNRWVAAIEVDGSAFYYVGKVSYAYLKQKIELYEEVKAKFKPGVTLSDECAAEYAATAPDAFAKSFDLAVESWEEQFTKTFSKQIEQFRHSEQTLFGNDDLSTELRYGVGDVVRNMYRVKLEIVNENSFVLSDKHGIALFVNLTEDGLLRVGVGAYGIVRQSCEVRMDGYTKDGVHVRRMCDIVKQTFMLFKAMMDEHNAIDRITEIVDKK